jgi:hypothetical protein
MLAAPSPVTTPTHLRDERAARLRTSNVRTALVFLSIALTFFFGVIAAKFMGGYEIGMSVVGVAVLVFLAFAIGRNLRRK